MTTSFALIRPKLCTYFLCSWCKSFLNASNSRQTAFTKIVQAKQREHFFLTAAFWILNFFLQLWRSLLLFPPGWNHTLLLLPLCSTSSTEYSHLGGVRLHGSADLHWQIYPRPLEMTHGPTQNHRPVDTNTNLFITVCFCLPLPLFLF